MLNGFLLWMAENEVLGFNVNEPEPTVCEFDLCSANIASDCLDRLFPRRAKHVQNEANAHSQL